MFASSLSVLTSRAVPWKKGSGNSVVNKKQMVYCDGLPAKRSVTTNSETSTNGDEGMKRFLTLEMRSLIGGCSIEGLTALMGMVVGVMGMMWMFVLLLLGGGGRELSSSL